ncbi:hypothetical protein [Lutibacter citreus]|uniref:hypothetical protein n=1 Tax=Lutibacter citreus TaxID=2138210 RepID=UPI000DBE37CB|nr:hypothetical protein [Lutibacter citreus]
MKNIAILIILTILISCKSEPKKELKTETIITDNFEIINPIENSKATLILFGGFGEKPADIKREFKILDSAKKNKICLVLMNYSDKIWLLDNEKKDLAKLLQNTLKKYNLNREEI